MREDNAFLGSGVLDYLGKQAPASLGEEYKVYENKRLKFSIEYPKEVSVEKYDEGDGAETIVFQNDNGGESFQIFIMPYDGVDGIIPADLIKKYGLVKVVEEPLEVVIGGGQYALIFWSKDDDEEGRKTREAWFAKGGNMYQITAFAEYDAWLAKILNTWKFE